MYQAKDFEHLLGLPGLSEPLLKNHFTLYQGYVNNFNKLDEILVGMEKEGKYSAPEYAELNRRLGWEFNGMRLHELYFENLTPSSSGDEPLTQQPPVVERSAFTTGHASPAEGEGLRSKIEKEFGSYDFWEKDFKAMGAMRGIGWVVLYYDKQADRLFNVWINEHDVGHLSGAAPLLVMDVFEHAYMLDYGLKRADYLEAFFKVIDWQAVEKRI